MEKTKAETTSKKETTTKSHNEPRNFLAAFLLVLSMGPLGINRLYTGETTIGWVRFGIFVAGALLTPIVVGAPLLLAATVWGIVDTFLVYHGDRKDADGFAMTETARDKKLAKILYIIYVVSLALLGLFILLGIAGIILAGIMYGWQQPAIETQWDYSNSF